MADGEIERAALPDTGPMGEVGLVRTGGIVVLDGPQEAVNRLIAGDPALRSSRPVNANSAAAIGALASPAPRMGLIGGGRTVFQMDAAGQALFDSGALMKAGDRFFRLVGKGADGKFSGQGALNPLSIHPEQLATAQVAMLTMTLTAAIKEVQEAVHLRTDLLTSPGSPASPSEVPA